MNNTVRTYKYTVKIANNFTLDKNKKYHRIERSYGKYERSFRLPDEVEADKVEASFKNGVLKLKLPKSAEKVPKKREIQVD